MRPTRHDGVMLVYNYAVVLSGGWLVTALGIREKWPLLAAAVVPAVVWTAYFRVRMRGRLEAEPEEEAEGDGEA